MQGDFRRATAADPTLSTPHVVDAVRRAIETFSPDERPRIEAVARALHTGVRTLQRRLAKAGTSYERLLTRARLGVAIRLLASTDASVLAIALDVGYSDHAHFTRAFRKWTGVAPRQFRKSRRAIAPVPARARGAGDAATSPARSYRTEPASAVR